MLLPLSRESIIWTHLSLPDVASFRAIAETRRSVATVGSERTQLTSADWLISAEQLIETKSSLISRKHFDDSFGSEKKLLTLIGSTRFDFRTLKRFRPEPPPIESQEEPRDAESHEKEKKKRKNTNEQRELNI